MGYKNREVELWDWVFVFFKQKTAYEMRISDWSSDVCSSDLTAFANVAAARAQVRVTRSAQFPAIGATAGAGYADRGDGAGSGDFSLQGGVTGFELYLFGRLANATEAERQIGRAHV